MCAINTKLDDDENRRLEHVDLVYCYEHQMVMMMIKFHSSWTIIWPLVCSIIGQTRYV